MGLLPGFRTTLHQAGLPVTHPPEAVWNFVAMASR